MIDSWLSVGAACVGNFGIPKTEDGAAGGTIVVNTFSPQIMQNNNPIAGIPLTVQDGIYAGAPEAVTTVGLTTADLNNFDVAGGNNFTTATDHGLP